MWEDTLNVVVENLKSSGNDLDRIIKQYNDELDGSELKWINSSGGI